MNMAERMLQAVCRLREALTSVHAADHSGVDAVVYPTMNIPPQKINEPDEPTVNNRGGFHWTVFGHQGFPTITVPSGFTTRMVAATESSIPN